MTEAIRGGSTHRVEMEALGSGGVGVGHLPDGRVVFVPLTAPLDRVRVRLDVVKPRWCRGEMVELLEPGPSRRSPPCPLFGSCGGCALQHLPHHVQLEAKGRQVREAMTRIGGVESPPAEELHAAPREFGYRNRVTLHLRRLPEGRVVAGFRHRTLSERVVEMDGECLLPEEEVGRAWQELRRGWGAGARRLPSGPWLRLTLRGVQGGGVLLLVEDGQEGGGRRRTPRSAPGRSYPQPPRSGDGDAPHLLREVPSLRAVWLQRGGEEAPRLLAGEGRLEEEWLHERIPVHPGAFTQVNREGAAVLQELVLREVGPPVGRRIVDAYCGFGVYGRRLARLGAEVTGVEADPRAVAMGNERPVDRFTMVEGRVEDLLPHHLPAGLVILNPPRGGVAPGVVAALLDRPPPRIVYVSCDPATLARDVAGLGPSFRLTRLQVVDLFPQTAHVETVATLDRSPAE